MEKLLNEYKENFYQRNKILEQFGVDNYEKLNCYFETETKELQEKYIQVRNKIEKFKDLLKETCMSEMKILMKSCINYGVNYKITNDIYYSKREDCIIKANQEYYSSNKEFDLLLSIINNDMFRHNPKNKRYNFENITMLKTVILALKNIYIGKDNCDSMYNIKNTYHEKLSNDLRIIIEYNYYSDRISFENNRTKKEDILEIFGTQRWNDGDSSFNKFTLFIDNKKEILSIVDKHMEEIDSLINNLVQIINNIHEYNKTFIMFEKLKQ